MGPPCWFLLIFLVWSCSGSPVTLTGDQREALDLIVAKDQLRTDWCPLPPEMGKVVNLRYIEDCGTLHQHRNFLPKPSFKRVGTHSLVCCPRLREETALCFPTDAWCPNFTPKDYQAIYDERQKQYEEEYLDNANEEENDFDDGDTGSIYDQQYYLDYEYDETINNLMSDQVCANSSESCVSPALCSGMLDSERAPESLSSPCGFDSLTSQLMICCPVAKKTKGSETPSLTQTPRFPGRGGGPRPCEDRHKLCGQYAKLGGCRLDTVHLISEANKLAFGSKVGSKEMFDWMSVTCPQSCGWCGDKGCVDEHPRCQEWAHNFQCHENPSFMAHTCRESCGVCGFLSPFNREEQVVDGLSYTDIDSKNFDCGRDLPRCEREGFSCDEPEPSLCVTEVRDRDNKTTTTTTPSSDTPLGGFDLRNTATLDQNDIFFAFNDSDGASCSSIPISDRWALGAAHCYESYETDQYDIIQRTVLRENTNASESVEIRKIFKHPLYKTGSLYNDLALLELGRRVVFDFEEQGVTPDCLDQGLDLTNWPATVSGFGLTPCRGEEGEISTNNWQKLREMNVTLIPNTTCQDLLRDTDLSKNFQETINNALPNGLNEGLVCAQGELNNQGVHSGACAGDSGGPVKVFDPLGRLTLVGLVSGGLGCGQGNPGWNTKIAFHREWVTCIMNRYALYKGNYAKTEKYCKDEVDRDEKYQQATVNELIFV